MSDESAHPAAKAALAVAVVFLLVTLALLITEVIHAPLVPSP